MISGDLFNFSIWRFEIKDISQHSLQSIEEEERFNLRVLLEQLHVLFQLSMGAIVLNMFVASLLAYMQWSVVAHDVVLFWFLAMIVALVYRSYTTWKFKHARPTWEDAKYWKFLFLSGSIPVAIVWGVASYWLMPDDYVHISVMVMVVLGIATGAVSTLSALRSTLFSFELLIAIPLIIALIEKPEVNMQVMMSLVLVYFIFMLAIGYSNYRTHLQSILLRLQSNDREDTLRKSEQMISSTSQILRMIAQGESAPNVYTAIANLYESRHPTIRCSILSLQGTQLMHSGAPSLPIPYCEAINGITIGAQVGSCGAAAYTGEQVLVEDIANDAKWTGFKNLALSYGLQSCWSEPIKDAEGTVLGTFAMYGGAPSLPSEIERVDLEAAAQLTGIVMERERREDLLRLHSNSLEQAGEAILITNTHGVIEYINPAYTRITGYTKEEVLGQNPRILKSGVQDDEYYKNMWSTISQGEIWSHKIVEKKKDGSFYTAHMTIAPVKNKEGRITHYVAFHSDLSEVEALEESFFQAQKLESIGVLVGGIAHDFNNILAAVKGNVYLANMSIEEPEKLRSRLMAIDDLSGRAADMTQQLLTFARKDRVEMKPLSLNKFAEEAFQLASTNIPENVEHTCTVCSQSLFIMGDRTQLQQLLMNLLNNARDAVATEQCPRVSCDIRMIEPSQQFLDEHPEVFATEMGQLTVQDNGCGIAEDTLNNIFEPFFTTKDVGQGTGLGLAMVYGSVKRHNGVIEVDSKLGQGTEFRLYFPLLRGFVEEEQPLEEIEYGNGEYILLVDDDHDMRETTSEVLQSLNYHVLEAEDGEVAFKVFEQEHEKIALVLTDIVMPKAGGVELAKAIRKMDKQVPIIFATGYDRNKMMEHDFNILHSQVLNKPFTFENLSQTLQAMIGQQNA